MALQFLHMVWPKHYHDIPFTDRQVAFVWIAAYGIAHGMETDIPPPNDPKCKLVVTAK